MAAPTPDAPLWVIRFLDLADKTFVREKGPCGWLTSRLDHELVPMARLQDLPAEVRRALAAPPRAGSASRG